MKLPKLNLNQKLTLVGILIPAVISTIALLKVEALQIQINPVIEMKPQINNVINNITEVKKEIANLQEMVKQQDDMWKREIFRKGDIDKKVVKFNKPADGMDGEASFVLIELNEIPLKNSVRVSRETGMLGSSTYKTLGNILRLAFLGNVDNVLDGNADFMSVEYLPDINSKETLWTVQGATIERTKEKDEVVFHFPKRS